MDRKQFLGSVFDELDHHFKLFTRERNVLLALAGLAGACLIAGVVVLAMRPAGHPAMAAAVLGAAGLVTIAAARGGLFFHGAIKMIEELVKRYSKLAEPDMESTVEAIRRKSELSLLLVGAGAAAVAFSVVLALVRVAQISKTVDEAKAETARAEVEIEKWKQSFKGSQEGYAALKGSLAALYGAHVTTSNRLIAVRAVAEKLAAARGAPANYAFSFVLQATPETLAGIRSVRYEIVHEATGAQVLEVQDAATAFRVSYAGTTCAPRVDVIVTMRDGASEAIRTDQCAALGPPWTATAGA